MSVKLQPCIMKCVVIKRVFGQNRVYYKDNDTAALVRNSLNVSIGIAVWSGQCLNIIDFQSQVNITQYQWYPVHGFTRAQTLQ